ncbi:MAG TPA: hypothetical protein VGB18_08895, partial [Candidatus Thermoplasmatota archaeon]
MVAGSWLGLVGYAATLVAFAFAAFLLHANPHAAANRRLALVLFFEGVFAAFLGTFVLFLDPAVGRTPLVLFAGTGFTLSAATVPWIYLLFLGTLRTPWVTPFAGPNAYRIVLTGLLLVLALDATMLT